MEKSCQPSKARKLPSWRLLVLLIPLGFIGLMISNQPTNQATSTRGPWERAFDSMVSPSTARALEDDNILRRNIMTLLDLSADASTWLEKRYPHEKLKQTTKLLNVKRSELSDIESQLQSKSLIKSLKAPRQLFGGGGNSGGGPLSGLGDLLKNGLAGVGDSILADLAGAGMFLGIGIGEGAASGLNFSTAANAKAVGTKVADSSGMKSTGLNPAIRNIGDGLTGTLLGAVDVGSLTTGVPLGPVVMGLATGLGNGAVSGLKIATVAAPNTNSTAAPDIASMFGFGLTSSVTGALDLKSLTNTALSPEIMQQIPAAVLGFSQGLGNGAVSGLKINTPAPPTGAGIPDIAGAFGFGLSQSVTSNVNVSQIASQVGGGADATQFIMKNLPQAAAGFGKGLGQGIPVGLGLQPDSEVPIKTMPDGSVDVSGVTQSFAMGLTSRFLSNGTGLKLLALVPAGGGVGSLVPNLNIGKAAGGFARGLLQGAEDGITAMGGLSAIINGSAITPTGPIPETVVAFDDSINGTAIGFAQGFGTQGALVVKTLVGQLNAVKRKRSNELQSTDLELAEPQRIQARQSNGIVTSDGTTTSFDLSSISALLNAETISGILQKGIELITCDGVGGLGLIAYGLSKSSVLSKDLLPGNITAQLQDVLPDGIIHFTNERNTYEIDLKQVINGLSKGILAAAGGIKVNGNKVGMLVAFLVIHILFAIVVMLNVVPLALSLQSARNILDRIGKPHILPRIPKWNKIMWLFVIPPGLLIIFIFGIVAVGRAAHFRTPHGILGLLTFIDGIAAVYLNLNPNTPPAANTSFKIPSQKRSPMQKANEYNNQLFLILAAVTSLTGFADVSKVALCLTHILSFEMSLSIGFSLSTLVTIASAVTGLEFWISFMDARKAKKSDDGIVEITVGTRVGIERVPDKWTDKKAGNFV